MAVTGNLPRRLPAAIREGEVTVHGDDEKTRGLMIGSKARNLRFTETVCRKYFPDLQEIKVV